MHTRLTPCPSTMICVFYTIEAANTSVQFMIQFREQLLTPLEAALRGCICCCFVVVVCVVIIL